MVDKGTHTFIHYSLMTSLAFLNPLITSLALIIRDTDIAESLFLDISVDRVVRRDRLGNLDESFAQQYIDAVRDGRLGDAIWARYQMFQGFTDGICEGRTVMELIEEDAVAYKRNEPEAFSDAVSFYRARMNSADGHVDIIDIIFRVDQQDISGRYVPLEG